MTSIVSERPIAGGAGLAFAARVDESVGVGGAVPPPMGGRAAAKNPPSSRVASCSFEHQQSQTAPRASALKVSTSRHTRDAVYLRWARVGGVGELRAEELRAARNYAHRSSRARAASVA